MATDLIRYDLLVQEALRGVVRDVLTETARNGLQGDHHFFITFKTHAPGLRLSSRMRERYPDEMTIILQHQFWDLSVTDHAFEVGLSFNKNPERLLVPFDAITSFVDPSVQFGLKFDTAGKDTPEEPADVQSNQKQALPPAKRVLTAVDNTASKKTPSKSSDAVVALKPHDIKPATPPIKATPPAKQAAPKSLLTKEPDKMDGGDKKRDGGEAKIVSIDAFRKKP